MQYAMMEMIFEINIFNCSGYFVQAELQRDQLVFITVLPDGELWRISIVTLELEKKNNNIRDTEQGKK